MADDTNKSNKAIELVARLSIDRASQVFSKLVKSGAKIEMQKTYIADISEVTKRISAENDEVVGSFVDLNGDVPLKFLFFVTMQDSLLLTDLILRREPGTTKELDLYALSAVQEIGNILASAISNVFSSDLGIKITPTPPVQVHDYAGTIFQEFIMSVGKGKDQILFIETCLFVVSKNIACHIFILPMNSSEDILSYITNIM